MLTCIGIRETNHYVRQQIFWTIFGLLLLSSFILQSKGLLQTPEHYHHFIDNRKLLGIQNLMDVVSNILFFIVSIYTAWSLNKNNTQGSLFKNLKTNQLNVNIVLTGCMLVGFGSAFYHLAPSDHRLMWDRLPMTIVFSGIVSHAITHLNLLPKNWSITKMSCSYLALSLFSVVLWYVGTLINQNWIGLYSFVQFGGIILLLYLAGSAYSLKDNTYLKMIMKVIGLYIVAKVAEHYDHQIFDFTYNIISGHSIKHMVSALALLVWFNDIKNLIK